MARGRQTRRIPDCMIGLAITCVVLAMARVRPAFLESLEYQTFDLRLRWFESRASAQDIAIVAIDDDGRSDLFFLGAVRYELLTGERPFQGDSIATIMFQITGSAATRQPDA